MTVEYIRYTLPPTSSSPEKRGEDLVAAYEPARASLDAAPECLSYELAACEEDPAAYILRIEWTSTEAHLQGFRKEPHFAAFYRAIGGFIPQIAEMRHYRVTSVHADKR